MKRKTRSIIQYLHMFGGVIIAIYIYSPWHDIRWFDIAVKAIVVPAIIISGLILWPVTAKLLRK